MWRRQHKFTSIVVIVNSLPSQPFLGHHLEFPIFSTMAFFRAACFFTAGLDITIIHGESIH